VHVYVVLSFYIHTAWTADAISSAVFEITEPLQPYQIYGTVYSGSCLRTRDVWQKLSRRLTSIDEKLMSGNPQCIPTSPYTSPSSQTPPLPSPHSAYHIPITTSSSSQFTVLRTECWSSWHVRPGHA